MRVSVDLSEPVPPEDFVRPEVLDLRGKVVVFHVPADYHHSSDAQYFRTLAHRIRDEAGAALVLCVAEGTHLSTLDEEGMARLGWVRKGDTTQGYPSEGRTTEGYPSGPRSAGQLDPPPPTVTRQG